MPARRSARRSWRALTDHGRSGDDRRKQEAELDEPDNVEDVRTFHRSLR